MSFDQIVMQIIVNGGDARASALKAVRSAREGNFIEADNLMKRSKESLAKAHDTQTQLIQAETRGEKVDVTLLIIHAQDHMMNALTIKDLAYEMIEDFKARDVVKKNG